MDVIRSRALRPGATLAVVSPASPIDEEKMLQGLAYLHDKGYRTKVFPHALDVDDYLAGSDEDRAADLTAAFDDPEVDGVYCSRGGYGCARLLRLLDLDRLAQSKKLLIGFSDITSLHIAWQRRGATTLHAPMALTLSTERVPWVYESFFRMLQGDVTLPAGVPTAEEIVPGTAEGLTVGGCLCLICDSLGTPEEIDTRGKIFMIEDVDENPHRVDAMMTHLLNAGKLQDAAGVVIGEMTRTDERSDQTIGQRAWREIVTERLVRAGVPSVINYPFGHMRTMLSVPLGVRARLNTHHGTVEYLDSPCDV